MPTSRPPGRVGEKRTIALFHPLRWASADLLPAPSILTRVRVARISTAIDEELQRYDNDPDSDAILTACKEGAER
ncbi:hypothetical protein AB0E82_32400 [Streptomyces anulatus]|uniref:hypothetical protein n=1 Tax=Streptomyces anulatus TaxID=1892 RepID=UPI0033D77496